jgi:hypothetical protein
MYDDSSRDLIAKLLYGYSEQNAALVAASSLDLFIKCPAATPGIFAGALLEHCGEADGLTTCTVAEATAATDGTARVPFNRNRLATPPASPVLVFSGPGTPAIVNTFKLGFATLGSNFRSGCWLLKPGVNYLVRMTAVTATRNVVSNISLGIIPNTEYTIKPWS